MPLRTWIGCMLLTGAVSCGDDSLSGCPEPFVQTPQGCEEPSDASAEDVTTPVDAAADAAPGVDAAEDAPSDTPLDTADAGPIEICNGMDDDGDDNSDEGLPVMMFYLDNDNDTFGGSESTCEACSPNVCGSESWSTNADDCDDACDRCFPGGVEVCDERNNDCDAMTDEGVSNRYFEDRDRDQFGSEVFVDACTRPDGFAIDGGDCADMEARAYPGATAYRAEPMANPPASGLAHDYNCDGVETHEIISVGNPAEVCGRPSCPENDRWEVLPACGGFGSVFRCFSVGLSCTTLESSQERALCR